MKEVALEYNLVEIDFNWEWDYIPSDDVISHFVADDSTIDAFLLSDILKTAVLVKEMEPKANKNQRPYEKMLLMRAFDNVKLIVGLQRSSQEHVQYSITVPEQ